MKPKRLPSLALAAAALALSACAGEKVWMRAGSGPYDAAFDEMACAEQAERGGVGISINGGAEPPTDRFSQRYACLRTRGYRLASLTAEESARLRSLDGADKEFYWRQLLVRHGLEPASTARPPDVITPASPAPLQ